MAMLQMRQTLEAVRWVEDTLNPSFLSPWFIEFFKGDPWNEYLMCPQCKDLDDFGPVHTYGIEEATAKSLRACPICGTQLEFFWGLERTRHYLFDRSDSDGIVALVGGEVAGWCRGYPTDTKTFYIDTVAILPQYRNQPGIPAFLEEFKNFLARKRLEYYCRFVTRTHKKAVNVRLLLRALGFHESDPAKEDPDRTYWQLG